MTNGERITSPGRRLRFAAAGFAAWITSIGQIFPRIEIHESPGPAFTSLCSCSGSRGCSAAATGPAAPSPSQSRVTASPRSTAVERTAGGREIPGETTEITSAEQESAEEITECSTDIIEVTLLRIFGSSDTQP